MLLLLCKLKIELYAGNDWILSFFVIQVLVQQCVHAHAHTELVPPSGLICQHLIMYYVDPRTLGSSCYVILEWFGRQAMIWDHLLSYLAQWRNESLQSEVHAIHLGKTTSISIKGCVWGAIYKSQRVIECSISNKIAKITRPRVSLSSFQFMLVFFIVYSLKQKGRKDVLEVFLLH